MRRLSCCYLSWIQLVICPLGLKIDECDLKMNFEGLSREWPRGLFGESFGSLIG